MIIRFPNNPLVTPADVKPSRPDFEVMCVFNAGATLYRGQTLLLMRVAERPRPAKGFVSTAVFDPARGKVKVIRVRLNDRHLDFTDPRLFTYKDVMYLTSISHLRLARSDDGRHFVVDPKPTVLPTTRYETFGIEDPRITFLAPFYYINYSAISVCGVTTCLARTKDFKTFEKLGVMFAPDNKDIAIFPEKIDGRYGCFHRPSMKQLGAPSMWYASSPNLRDWGGHEFIIGPRPGMWDSERVGCGAAPIKTPHGWLELYHGSAHKLRYCSGALLLDLKKPWRVIARSRKPLLEPTAPYEAKGFVPNVVFQNGLVQHDAGTVDLYYGAADQTTCGATLDLKALLATL